MRFILRFQMLQKRNVYILFHLDLDYLKNENENS